MDYGLGRKVAFVTGGSSGIGKATAFAFSREGARVAISYRKDRTAADAVVAAIAGAGGEAMAVPMDLGAPEGIRPAVREVTSNWGGIDVLVSNAAETARHAEAFGPAGVPFAEIPAGQWRPQLTGGLEGIFRTVQAVLPAMHGRGFGRIVFVSSAAAEHGGPREEAYAAAKAALAGLTASLSRELGPDGIFVNIVMPAMTATERVVATVPAPVREMIASRLATKKLSVPDDIAAAIVFLCSAANGNITGETLRVTGGI